MCGACHDTVQVIKDILECDGCLLDIIRAFLVGMCLFVEHWDVCYGLINDYIHEIMWGLYDGYINPTIICHRIDACSQPKLSYGNFTEFADNILHDKPEPVPLNRTNEAPVNFGHISDVHLDLIYKEGSLAECDEPLCCEEKFGNGTTPENTAGYWGHYACDIPPRTMHSGMQSLANKTLDFVLYTGDSPSHNIWNQSHTSQQDHIGAVSDALGDAFQGIPIYPVLGNHGCYPPNTYSFGNEDWLTSYLGDIWTKYLPQKSIDQIRVNGAYSVKHPGSNLKIIVPNTQACYYWNFYLIANNTDPGEQLDFLVNELKEAEENGESVYIAGHIPPGNLNCMTLWNERYNAIVDRYEGIIRGQFFGHTHWDHLVLSRTTYTNRPTSVQWIAPSMTTFSDNNPSYRVFQADPVSYEVLNYQQHRINLTDANLDTENPPDWFVAYDFLSEYNATSVAPEEVLRVMTEMQHDETSCTNYVRNKYTDPTNNPILSVDNYTCMQDTCDAIYTTREEQLNCSGAGKGAFLWIIELVAGRWTWADYD